MRQTGPSSEFNRLVEAGCDPKVLEKLLENVRNVPPPPSQLEVRGGSAREIRASLARIRKAARDIRFLGQTFVARMILLAGNEYSSLPEVLERFAQEFERVAPAIHPGPVLFRRGKKRSELKQSHPLSGEDIANAMLTGYVLSATGRPHDGVLSALLRELPGRGGYSPKKQTMWRGRHEPIVCFYRDQWKCRPNITKSPPPA